MLTLDQWVQQFAADAATLPGWRLTDGKLRRRDTALGVYACPLMAAWNLRHPDELAADSVGETLARRWEGLLDGVDAWQVMDAADEQGGPAHVAFLRAALLAACGVAEEPDHG